MWKMELFEDTLDNTKVHYKLPKKEYLSSGKFPVVSQEESMISGFHNNSENVFRVNKPVIVFGDHTRVLKYIDFDFVVGADGVKILLPIEEIDSKFFYYFLMSSVPKSKGYARHYSLLRKILIPIPPLEQQKQIVKKLDAAFAEIDKNIENLKNKQIDNYMALKSSILTQELKGRKAA